MNITNEDRDTPLYRKLRDSNKERIAVFRARLEDSNLSERETAVIRGHIEELKYQLSLGNTASAEIHREQKEASSLGY